MKKVIAFLLLSGLLTQCSTNNDDNLYEEEEEQLEEPEDLTISLSIEGNLMNELQEKILYIVNEEGLIEDQAPLNNNEESFLSISREPKVQYDLVIYDKSENYNNTRHTFDVYQNIQSAEYTIDAPSGTRETTPKINLNLVNTGNLKQIGMTGGGSSTASSSGGGYFNFEGFFLTKPGNFYTSFKKEGESFGRYFWVENIEEDISVSLDYEELPSTTLTQTQLPEHNNGTIFIFGLTSSFPSAAHHLGYGSTQGNSTYETYLPNESIFDLVGINATLSKENTSYRVVTYAESLPSSINLPSFDLSINNFSHNNVDFTTTGAYDYSVTTFGFSEENQDFVVVVNVHSQPGSEISFSIASLLDSVLETLPNFDSTKLQPINISLTSLSYHSNYTAAIKGKIENKVGKKEPGYLLETVSRRVE